MNTKTKSKSEAPPPRGDDWRPKCRNHSPPLELAEAILRFHYPAGWLPVRGFRCKECGTESLMAEDAANMQAMARKLGLYGLDRARNRKILRTGGSLAVTLDPGLLEEVFGSAKAGTTVRVGRSGDRIVIEAAD